jgi:hypothetical protein
VGLIVGCVRVVWDSGVCERVVFDNVV